MKVLRTNALFSALPLEVHCISHTYTDEQNNGRCLQVYTPWDIRCHQWRLSTPNNPLGEAIWLLFYLRESHAQRQGDHNF